MGTSSKKTASEAGDAPPEPPITGKREADDIIRNDNRKKRKKHKKKAVVEENDGGAKTRETLIKEKDDDYMDEQELKVDSCVGITDQVKVSADINPMDSNPRLGDESGVVKKNASAPKETPVTNNGHRGETENDHPKEEIDDGEGGDAATEPPYAGKREVEDFIRNDNRKKREKRKKKAMVEENDSGAKTMETLIKEKEDDYMDWQELKTDSCVGITDQVKVSANINPMDSNPRLGDESGFVKKNASAPKQTPATNNGHRDKSENDPPKEEIDDGEGGDAPTGPPYTGKKEEEDIIRNDNRKKRKKKAVVEENDSGAKTLETIINEKDDDYMQGKELKVDSCVVITDRVKVSADVNPMDSSPRLGDGSSGVKKNASAPKETPATDNGHRDESEIDHPKEEIYDGKAGDAPTEPLPCKGKREAEDIIRNDNRKKHKKHKKAGVGENEGGAKTRETLIKKRDGNYMDEQELKGDARVGIIDQVMVSADINPTDSNPRFGDENSSVKKNASAPNEMPTTNIGHRDESENDRPKEEIDDGEAGDAATEPPYIGKREAEDIIRNDNRKKRKKRKKKTSVGENNGGTKTWETLIKEKDGDYMEEQELKVDSRVLITDQVKVSADVNPMDSNPRLGDERSGVKKNASAPKETPATNNGHRGESENDHPKEEIDDGEPKTKKFKVSLSGTLIPAKSNFKAAKEDGGGEEERLEEEPSKMHEVESVTFPVENNSSEEISSEEDMAASSDEEETEMDAAPKEQSSGSKTIYVAHLSLFAKKAHVRNFFKAAGEIVDVCLNMGSGLVEFTTIDGAVEALNKLNGKVLKGRSVKLRPAKEEEIQSFQKGGRALRQTIFVRGFNKDDGEDQIRSALRDHFGSCGEIFEVSIPKDKEGGVRGIAYIGFKDYDAYNQALEFNGSVFHKNILRVDAANPRDGGWRGGRGAGGGFSGKKRGGRTGRGCFKGGGQGGRGRAAPGGS